MVQFYILHRILILANILNWTFRGLHIVPGALYPIITDDAHPGRITPNGRGSVSAIHDIASCHTLLVFFSFHLPPIGDESTGPTPRSADEEISKCKIYKRDNN